MCCPKNHHLVQKSETTQPLKDKHSHHLLLAMLLAKQRPFWAEVISRNNMASKGLPCGKCPVIQPSYFKRSGKDIAPLLQFRSRLMSKVCHYVPTLAHFVAVSLSKLAILVAPPPGTLLFPQQLHHTVHHDDVMAVSHCGRRQTNL